MRNQFLDLNSFFFSAVFSVVFGCVNLLTTSESKSVEGTNFTKTRKNRKHGAVMKTMLFGCLI